MQKSRLFIRMGKNVARAPAKPRRAEPNHNASIFQPPARAQQPKSGSGRSCRRAVLSPLSTSRSRKTLRSPMENGGCAAIVENGRRRNTGRTNLFLYQPLRSCISPRRNQGLLDGSGLCMAKADDRRPAPPPCAAGGPKNVGLGADERRLLVGFQLDHSPIFVRPQCRKDFTTDPEIWMTHVRGFRHFRKTEGEAPELVCGHPHIIPDEPCKSPGC